MFERVFYTSRSRIWIKQSVATHARKIRRLKRKKSEDRFKVEHQPETPAAVLTMDVVTSLCFNDLCNPIEKYIYVSKKHPLRCRTTAKHPKRNKLQVTNINRKTSGLFWLHQKDVYFSPRNNLANFSAFTKVFEPV